MTDYTRDHHGRKLPKRSRDVGCDDCGSGRLGRRIRFYSGMEYNVCAQHEHEYCGTPKQRLEHDEAGVACVVPISWDIPAWLSRRIDDDPADAQRLGA